MPGVVRSADHEEELCVVVVKQESAVHGSCGGDGGRGRSRKF